VNSQWQCWPNNICRYILCIILISKCDAMYLAHFLNIIISTHKSQNIITIDTCWLPTRPTLLPRRWRQYILPKRHYASTRLFGITLPDESTLQRVYYGRYFENLKFHPVTTMNITSFMWTEAHVAARNSGNTLLDITEVAPLYLIVIVFSFFELLDTKHRILRLPVQIPYGQTIWEPLQYCLLKWKVFS
jgi:hypothetical protein